MRAVRCSVLVALLWVCPLASGVSAGERIAVGSKNFNENYLLGEVIAQLLEARGFDVERRFGMNGTLVAYEALRTGEIDVYVEYSGTLAQVILGIAHPPSLAAFEAPLAPLGLGVLDTFGFNNTYAIVLGPDVAASTGITTLSELAARPELELGFSHEFQERQDGWPGLAAAYGLPHRPRGIEHGLAYQAIASGVIDGTDAYSTDGDIERYGLVTLTDDRGYFPRYYAVPFVRLDLDPSARAAIESLAGRLDATRMRALNARVVVDGHGHAEVAADFLRAEGFDVEARTSLSIDWDALRRNMITHLALTGAALGGAVVVGVGLAVLVHGSARVSATLLYATGLLQTIPSIALLALMIPLLGIGLLPAIVALFLYSLLPIVRNTLVGLTTIDPDLRNVALAMGFTPAQRLRHLFLPLALPSIFAGVRTAAVISIGTATLAAFIGAGGLGEPIVTGLALNDPWLILQGAVPAALLAIVTELGFGALERLVVPRTLRARR